MPNHVFMIPSPKRIGYLELLEHLESVNINCNVAT